MTARDINFKVNLSDGFSKKLDAIIGKMGQLPGKLQGVNQKLEGDAKTAAAKLIAIEDKRERDRIRLQRNSIALEERMEKQRAALMEQNSRNSLQQTKSRAAAQERMERQAAIVESQLVLDKFERRIAMERVKHAHILTDLKRANQSREFEDRRHAAVISRIQMDQGNFANTPFQKMLGNFNKLNQGLSKVAPSINIAQSSVVNLSGSMSLAAGASNALGGALSGLALGPVGLAVTAVAGLSAGINLLIGRAEAAAALKEKFGSQGMKDPAQVQQLLNAMEKFEAARGKRGAGAVNASKEVKALTGESAEDMSARGMTASVLRGQLDALNKIKENKRVNNDDAKRLDKEVSDARIALVQDETKRQLAAENARHQLEKNALAGHKENLAKEELNHALRVQKIQADAAETARKEKEKQEEEDRAFEESAASNAAKREEAFAKSESERREKVKQDKQRSNEDRIKSEKIFATRQKEIDEARQAAAFQTAANLLSAGQMLFSQTRKNAGLLKTLAIGEIGVNTGRSFMQALATPPGPPATVPLALSIGALGLAQAAKVSQQRFARGTNFAPGGMALVGEEGPELMFVPRGSQVKTAQETRQIMNSSFSPTIIINVSGSADPNRIADTVDDRLRGLAKDMKVIRERNITA